MPCLLEPPHENVATHTARVVVVHYEIGIWTASQQTLQAHHVCPEAVHCDHHHGAFTKLPPPLKFMFEGLVPGSSAADPCVSTVPALSKWRPQCLRRLGRNQYDWMLARKDRNGGVEQSSAFNETWPDSPVEPAEFRRHPVLLIRSIRQLQCL